jgi:DNA polymerase-4
VVAPSIEAKTYGIKTGMTVRDARLLYPAVIVRTPDPTKYRYVHLLFRKIFRDYSPDVTPKSIDEAVIDLTHTLPLFSGGVVGIGREIKRRFRTEIGEWMRCSIGVSTNRFLAKLAAGLKKPDGLEIIDHTNVLAVYSRLKLLDLCGINTRYQARLNAHGIFTPMEFYNSPLPLPIRPGNGGREQHFIHFRPFEGHAGSISSYGAATLTYRRNVTSV